MYVPNLGFVLGFGKTTITGEITWDVGIFAERNASAFILLFFIIGLK